MNNLFVVLPCYNEEKDVKSTIAEWHKQLPRLKEFDILKVEIIAVNDGSKDNTLKVLEACKVNYGDITVINHPINKGLGQAVKTGILYVEKICDEKDYICIMDADNTQNPAYVIDMLMSVKALDADCVIASRYRQNSNIKGVSLFRNILSLGARFYYSVILRIPGVRDYTCGYRLYRTSIVKKALDIYDSNFIEENGFSCMVEILYKIHLCNGKVSEVPFQLRYDLKTGASKMKVFKNIIKSFELVYKLRSIKSQDIDKRIIILNKQTM